MLDGGTDILVHQARLANTAVAEDDNLQVNGQLWNASEGPVYLGVDMPSREPSS